MDRVIAGETISDAGATANDSRYGIVGLLRFAGPRRGRDDHTREEIRAGDITLAISDGIDVICEASSRPSGRPDCPPGSLRKPR